MRRGPSISKSRHQALKDARTVLDKCKATTDWFLAECKSRRSKKKGTPSDHEQDLLRAALVFACAGLDAMAKQLVSDALPVVLAHNQAARRAFAAKFVQRRLQGADQTVDVALLSRVLLDQEPHKAIERALIEDLTKGSLQNRDEVVRVASAFAIDKDELFPNRDSFNDIKNAFDARNQMIHEMDIRLDANNRSRRSRTQDTMRDLRDVVLETSVRFFNLVAERLPKP
jgi:hypothetical protein